MALEDQGLAEEQVLAILMALVVAHCPMEVMAGQEDLAVAAVEVASAAALMEATEVPVVSAAAVAAAVTAVPVAGSRAQAGLVAAAGPAVLVVGLVVAD